jgi:hypothetical protein
MFEVIHKSLQLLHEKIEEQKQSPPNTSLVNDLLLQFSKKQGITIDEETISKLLRGLF